MAILWTRRKPSPPATADTSSDESDTFLVGQGWESDAASKRREAKYRKSVEKLDRLLRDSASSQA